MNPPFTVPIINRTIRFILKQLQNTSEQLAFLLVIPVWDNNFRKKLNKICKTKLKIKNYDEDVDFDILYKSKYFTQCLLYCKENFTYYDYIKMQNCKFAPTLLITISNNNMKLNIQSIFGHEDIKIK